MKIEEMISTRRADCTGCEACANVCPKNCIAMQRDDEGFAYPKINHEICIGCGSCDKTCPSLNFVAKMPEKLPETFVAVHPDAKVRRHSSSGGTFTALSEIILSEGGIIFGAGFDENWHVVHTSAENFEELENLRGSKYVQSQIGDVYKHVKIELKNNRQVLFSGTPCQCAGLKSFLGKDFENLLTVDLICHGTPSPKLWESYIDYRAMGHDIASVNFRSKRYGWKNSHLEINFYDCGYYARTGDADLFLKHFGNAISERPSCHECKFKFPNGKADVTIADAWGVENFAREMFDNRGTSLVIVHNEKGKNFFAKAKLIKRTVSFDVMPTCNPHSLVSSIPDENRKNFFDDLKKFPQPISVMQKYFHQPAKSSGRDAGIEAMQKYGAILQHLANIRAKNLLIMTPPLNNNILNSLAQNLSRDFKGSGIYFLQVQSDNKIIFIDGLHPVMHFGLQANVENLRALIKNFHLTDILIDRHINLGENGINFLESCGAAVKSFELKGN